MEIGTKDLTNATKWYILLFKCLILNRPKTLQPGEKNERRGAKRSE
jgi:hypothetical protein